MHRGKGPKGYRRADSRIEEDVNERLTQDPFIDPTDIAVSVKDGVVTLQGHVASRADKRRAEDCALDVHGVSDCLNNLRIMPERH
ncbi:BON domain-containing protein [Rhizobium sp. LC145]|uniref:BON domain-containing protein n=1 Tax=Rhizobium sp. LC145 TaxID=1120688 RepID=UPI002477ED67|nr:BON domain-containing protein [Rhizobium sp. LC145]